MVVSLPCAVTQLAFDNTVFLVEVNIHMKTVRTNSYTIWIPMFCAHEYLGYIVNDVQ